MTNDIGTKTASGGTGGNYQRVSESPGRSVEDATIEGRPECPVGIKILAGLGTLFNLLAMLIGLSLFQYGGVGILAGLFVITIAALHIYVLLELVRMTPWAYGATMLLYGLGGFVQLLTLNVIGLAVTVLIMAYLWTKADLY
jgi:hypothetical protein